jgi:hypothetical protein
MTAAERDRARQDLEAAVRSTPACIPIERLGEALRAPERDHLSTCTRCQVELALWEKFRESTPAPDDGAAVQWIVAEVRRRRSLEAPARQPWIWPSLLRPRAWLAAAATVVFAVSAGYLVWDREPGLRDPGSTVQEYRTAALHVISPTGDLREPPTALEWAPLSGAVTYEVAVLEVDRTVLWRAFSSVPRVALPPSLTAQFVPGKAVLWEVTARNESGAAIAATGTQRFKLTPRS